MKTYGGRHHKKFLQIQIDQNVELMSQSFVLHRQAMKVGDLSTAQCGQIRAGIFADKATTPFQKSRTNTTRHRVRTSISFGHRLQNISKLQIIMITKNRSDAKKPKGRRHCPCWLQAGRRTYSNRALACCVIRLTGPASRSTVGVLAP